MTATKTYNQGGIHIMMNVKVGKMPGTINKVSLAEGATVGQAIREAGIQTAGYEVRLNGNLITDMDVEVSEGNIVLLVQKIKGNNDDHVMVRFEDKNGKELNEVVVVEGTTVEAAFALAGYDVEDTMCKGAILNDDNEDFYPDHDLDDIDTDCELYHDLVVTFAFVDGAKAPVVQDTDFAPMINFGDDDDFDKAANATKQGAAIHSLFTTDDEQDEEGSFEFETEAKSDISIDVDTTGDSVLISIVTSKAFITILTDK